MKLTTSLVSIMIVFACFTTGCLACLNDRDTLAEEVQGLPDVVQIITGRFARNPPLFYQMRIQRVSSELRSHPSLLGDYDDIGVAYDRLGQDDAAIRWLSLKRIHLPPYDPSNAALKEQWYRYYANVGTCRVHRWMRAGADRAKISEVEQARDEIAQAIAIKPDAHLGRENYQLQVMKWIITGQPFRMETISYSDGDGGHSYQEPDPQTFLAWHIVNFGNRETVTGLTGLIALGNAWESVDIFYSLSQRLDFRQSHIANLAKLRCAELIDEGHGSIIPGSPQGDALKKALKLDQSSSHTADYQSDRQDYVRLRSEAEQWQKQRTAYMMTRLLAGRHPDTDPTFWKDYHDYGPPQLTIPWNRRVALALRRVFGYPGGDIVPFVAFFLSPFLLYYLFSRRKVKRARRNEISLRHRRYIVLGQMNDRPSSMRKDLPGW